MTKKIEKILIVGGGSAGWMSAATLKNAFPDKEIVLIESPNVPTIGVGESTLGSINSWLATLGIKDENFMKACDATYKFSIRFREFTDVGCEPFHYPFGIPYLQTSDLGTMDWHLKKALYPETPLQDYARTFMPAMALVDRGRVNTNDTGVFDNFRFDRDTAYHFNAVEFAAWLKDSYSIPRGVKHISDDVTDVVTGPNGVEHIVTKNNGNLTADLYLDCTGFKSLLLEKSLNVPFISYKHQLPNNNAWVVQLPYEDIEKELQTFTDCTALGNGWVWNTPLISRIGTGYVFCDDYISHEDALEEFKQHLMSDKMVVPRTREQVDSYSFRLVPFKSGIHEQTWVKNVCAIGLSAGFLEPLESTGLYTVHEFLLMLVKSLGRGKVTQWDRDVYNTTTKNKFDNFAEFVGIHYAFSHRDDTQYWRDIGEKTFSVDMTKLNPTRTVGYYDVSDQYMFAWDFNLQGGTHFIATGMGFAPVDMSRVHFMEALHRRNYQEIVKNSNAYWENSKAKWIAAAEASPTHYQYLKNTIYK